MMSINDNKKSFVNNDKVIIKGYKTASNKKNNVGYKKYLFM